MYGISPLTRQAKNRKLSWGNQTLEWMSYSGMFTRKRKKSTNNRAARTRRGEEEILDEQKLSFYRLLFILQSDAWPVEQMKATLPIIVMICLLSAPNVQTMPAFIQITLYNPYFPDDWFSIFPLFLFSFIFSVGAERFMVLFCSSWSRRARPKHTNSSSAPFENDRISNYT